MAFSAGDLCCASSACVLLDVSATSSETWDLLPHVTNVGFTQTANTPKIVTSSSAGEEISVCGNVTTTGTLTLACHNGVSPGVLCINYIYQLRWSVDCDEIWTGGAVVGSPTANNYFQARVRITSVPITYDIAGNQAVQYQYTWELVEWVNYPGCEASSGDA